MVPRFQPFRRWTVDLLQLLLQAFTHFFHALDDIAQTCLPFLQKDWIREYSGDDSGPIVGGRSLNYSGLEFSLRHDACGIRFGTGNEMDRASPLALKTKILCLRIGAHQIKSIFEEQTYRLNIIIKRTRSKSKLSRIEEWEQIRSL